MQADVKEFTDDLSSVNPMEVMQTILLTQYMDTLRDVGSCTCTIRYLLFVTHVLTNSPVASKSTSIFVPTGLGAIGDLSSQMRQGIMEANAAFQEK